MPKSKVRKKVDAPSAPRTGGTAGSAAANRSLRPSPTWYPVVMCVVFVIGLAYLVVYYLAADKIPVMQDLGAWNFAVGFGILVVGLLMAVRWR